MAITHQPSYQPLKNKSFSIKHILAITLIVASAYAVALTGDFVLDDYSVIVNNGFIKKWDNFPLIFSRGYLTSFEDVNINQGAGGTGSGETTYRPVATASYFLNYAAFGLRPWGYRLVNVTLHILNAVLAYLLLCLLFRNRRLALFSAILFGIHPVNAETISCSGYRPNLLVFLFGVLSIILYFKFNPGSGKRRPVYLFFSILSFLLAVFSKETGVVLLPALILCDFYYLDLDFKKLSINFRWHVFYFAAGLFYAGVYFLLMPPNQEVFRFTPFWGNLARMLNVFGIYLKDLVFPADPAYIPAGAIKNSYFMAALSLGVILAAALSIKKIGARRQEAFSFIWFFLWLLPLNNFLSSFRVSLANRFLYVPVLGFALLLGVFLTAAREGKVKICLKIPVLRYMLPFALFAYFFIFSVSANVLWRNELLLSQAAVERYPFSPAAHLERGRALVIGGRYDKAQEELGKALSLIRPDAGASGYDPAKAYILLGIIHTQRREYAQAEEAYLKAAGLLPNAAMVRTQLGILYDLQGMQKKALQQLEAAKEINRKYVPAYIESARVYMGMRDYPDAETEFLKAQEIDPANREAEDGLKNVRSIMKGMNK